MPIKQLLIAPYRTARLRTGSSFSYNWWLSLLILINHYCCVNVYRRMPLIPTKMNDFKISCSRNCRWNLLYISVFGFPPSITWGNLNSYLFYPLMLYYVMFEKYLIKKNSFVLKSFDIEGQYLNLDIMCYNIQLRCKIHLFPDRVIFVQSGFDGDFYSLLISLL